MSCISAVDDRRFSRRKMRTIKHLSDRHHFKHAGITGSFEA